jgi:hypothetical protein
MPGDRPGWFRRRSIRLRVTVAASAALLVALIIGAFALIALQRRSMVDEIDRSLRDRIVGLIDSAQMGQLTASIPVTGRETGIVQIITSDGQVLASTPGLADTAVLNRVTARLDAPTYGSVRNLNVFSGSKDEWRIAALSVNSRIGPVGIYAATTLGGVNHLSDRLTLLFATGIPILEVLLILAVWFSVGRALRPVEALATQVDHVDPEHLEFRLTEQPTGDEIEHLASTMNGLLERLHQSRERERRFAADASHELRSPLAAARLGLEVAVAHPEKTPWPDVAADTLAELERLEVLARDLLDLTRLDAARTVAASRPLDLAALIRAELELRAQRRPELGFGGYLALLTVRGVPELLLRALRNALDNAERHAANSIEVRLEPIDGMAVLTVSNDGTPIAAADRDRVFQPFVRLDESRSADGGGTGLGLAIVSDILHAHGGKAAFVDPPSGSGASLQLSIPLVEPLNDWLPPGSPAQPPPG